MPMGHHRRRAGTRTAAMVFAATCALAFVVLTLGVGRWWSAESLHSQQHHRIRLAADARTGDRIVLNGARPGSVFDGIGAISGGGGNSRLLIDYLTRHPQQAQQVLDYLFKPGYGANLQALKIEIGGDANATDGAEPSYQHTRGVINCAAGYELWLARQARALNPKIAIYALQWNAPGWVGQGHEDAWTPADISYIIGWLNCAKSQGVTVNYVGGWNEHLPHGITPTVMNWFVKFRAALDAAGYGSIKIVALDSFAHVNSGDDISDFLASNPAFSKAVSVIGYHDVCKHQATVHRCVVPPAARSSGKPIWETEAGAMKPPGDAGAMARSINYSYIEAGVTGLDFWPMMSAMPAGLPLEGRGLVVADQPWSGRYQVNQIAWAVAQTTQFAQPGWRHILGGAGDLASGGSYVGYQAPGRRGWSLVAQTSDASAAQVVTVHVSGGLPASTVHVWSTSLSSRNPGTWFVRGRDVHLAHGTFRYRLSPGYIYTFTTTTGQGKGSGTSPDSAPMPVSYHAFADASGEPWGLATQDGAFQYLAGSTTTFAQTAHGMPDVWQPPKPGQAKRFPYAILGGSTWRDYTVSTGVKFTGQQQSAGLIARYARSSFGPPVNKFAGYEFTVSASGHWALVRNEVHYPAAILATGQVARLGTTRWHTLSLAVRGAHLVARIDGRQVASAVSSAYRGGVAGIRTGGWYRVLFRNLTVS
jgi:hypothetical protein